MKADAQLQKDILAELKWDPVVNETDVGVIVKEGVVTLTGHLASYAEKCAAERAAQRVHGVKALAVELTVKLPSPNERTDAQIAAAADVRLKEIETSRANNVRAFLTARTPLSAEEIELVLGTMDLVHQERTPTSVITAERHRTQTIAALGRYMILQADTSPLLLLAEDAHWFDRPTLELLLRCHRPGRAASARVSWKGSQRCGHAPRRKRRSH